MSEPLHLHHPGKHKPVNPLLLLIPAFIFVMGIALFLQNRTTGQIQAEHTEAPKIVNIKVGEKTIQAKVVDTEATRKKGLGGTTYLSPDEGMYFDFGTKDFSAVFWMKDMVIPIDIIWINDDKITQIDKNVEPEPGVADNNLRLYPSESKIDGVLEVASGFSDANNLKIGDSLEIIN